jgi:hypothetical protein
MKKILVMILLVSVVLVSVFADPIGTDSISVWGKIGEGVVSFEATKEHERIDLKNNLDVQPDGNGVKVGSWVFIADNQNEAGSYTVGYTTTPMTSGSTQIHFNIVDTVDDVVSVVSMYNFPTTIGNNEISKDIYIRLVNAITDEPSGDSYNGEITFTLTSN